MSLTLFTFSVTFSGKSPLQIFLKKYSAGKKNVVYFPHEYDIKGNGL